MVVGDENVGERPALFRQGGENRRCFRRIDRGGGACGGIVNEDTKIVLKTHKLMNLRSHANTLSFRAATL